jgi:uncharacterized membrane protein HdeD (DUF308 family)
MLFQELGKVKRTWIMSSIILMVIGIGMLICPDKYMGLMVATLGYVLLVVATVFVLDFLSSKKALINYVLLINPFWDTPAALKVVIGVMMLFSSVVSIIRTVLTWPIKTA